MGQVDGGSGRAPFHTRKPPRVAVGQHVDRTIVLVVQVLQQRKTRLCDPAAGRNVLLGHRDGQLACSGSAFVDLDVAE